MNKRRGVAAVEAAFCLPVLMLIFFSAIEISGGLFQEYDLQICSFELSKTALLAQSTCEDVQKTAEELLPQLGFENYEIEIVVEPRTVNQDSVEAPDLQTFTIPQTGPPTGGLEELPRGTLLRLTVIADRPSVSGIPLLSYLGQKVDASSVFVKEY